MGPANTAGPAAPDLSPPEPADAQQLRRRLEQGEWLVDLRTRTAFAAGHAPGTLNFGLDGSFATYLGWLIPWGTPVTLLGETAEQVARGATGNGPDRHRPARGRRHRRPRRLDRRAASHRRAGHLRRPGPRAASPPRGHPGRAAPPGMGGVAHRRLRAHPAARTAAAAPARSRPGSCGCTAPPVTGRRSPRRSCSRSGHRVIAVDDDYTNAAAAGLPITSAGDHEGNRLDEFPVRPVRP